MANVLVIEKEAEISNALATGFPNEVMAESLFSVDRVKERLNEQKFDLIICNADFLPSERMKTFRFLQRQISKFPKTKVIIVSDFEELYDPGGAWKGFERIERALDQAHLFAIIRAALQKKPPSDDLGLDGSGLVPPTDLEGIMAISLPMRFALEQAPPARKWTSWRPFLIWPISERRSPLFSFAKPKGLTTRSKVMNIACCRIPGFNQLKEWTV